MRATLTGRYRGPPGLRVAAARSSAALSVRRPRAKGRPSRDEAKIRGITPGSSKRSRLINRVATGSMSPISQICLDDNPSLLMSIFLAACSCLLQGVCMVGSLVGQQRRTNIAGATIGCWSLDRQLIQIAIVQHIIMSLGAHLLH
eukprot:GHRR01030021.1.p1 GENE.GHRR01030021.1~~GHRR01030021.1.p1  ORF type:complete len:145 (+),score=26.45 GHRR01030021.1:730-1164(+)